MNDSGNAWVIYSLAKLQRSVYWNQLNNVIKKFGYYIITLSVVDFLVGLISFNSIVVVTLALNRYKFGNRIYY